MSRAWVRNTQATSTESGYHHTMPSELGRFLRLCRDRTQPAEAGSAGIGRRRVTGLRREEVAVLAGVSSDYYTQLEQGRERHPSAQLLDLLADTFQLTADQRQHLFDIAGIAAPLHRRRLRSEVSPHLRQLMQQWPDNPSFVFDRNWDLLARNDLGEALYSGFSIRDNLARMTFLDPFAQRFYVDWDRSARSAAGALRLAYGLDANDARLNELIQQLLSESDAFTELWERHEPQGKSHEAKSLNHPDVGMLTLSYQALDVREAAGQQLIVYYAESGSRSATALKLLGSVAATSRHS